VALAREADVVGVAPAVAVGGGADVGLAAAGALDQPGEQVVASVGAPKRGVLTALAQKLRRSLEQRGVDQRLVQSGVVAPAEVDLAQVGAVAQDRQHREDVEGLAALGPVAALAQSVGDRGRALEPLCVAAETSATTGASGADDAST
jgi:hypothetical protein